MRIQGLVGGLVFFVLALGPGGTPQAADDTDTARQYDIELLVFRNLVENDGGEVWPAERSGWYEDELIDSPGTAAPPQAVQWLAQSDWRLRAERAALDRSAGYRTLAYFAWRQPVVDRAAARPVELSARSRKGGAWVDGTVTVAVERYLHLSLDLQLHLPASATTAGFREPAAEPQELRLPEIHLTQQRRMRSRELHYFDNPRFGVMALITPYEPPAEVLPEPPPDAPPVSP